MFILGDLLRTDGCHEKLPAAWWHRAPLGFETGTQVFVSLTERRESRPGDLLVSVLNPNRWGKSFRIRCSYEDKPGVLARLFMLAKEHAWNIALAETATTEGRVHRLNLICEPQYPGAADIPPGEIGEALQSRGFLDVSVNNIVAPEPIQWHRLAQVRNGWIEAKPGRLTWRTMIQEQAEGLEFGDQFDLDRLVVSADTENRLLRFVVPRHGARTVIIEHADEPGALHYLTGALVDANLNILSCLLKRGGAAPRNAIIVAVCEPALGSGFDDASIDDRIREAIRKVPDEFRPAAPVISTGMHPKRVIYSRHPDDTVIHVPERWKARVSERRSSIPRGQLPVFLSQRFVTGVEGFGREARRVLESNGCHVIQAPVLQGGTVTSMSEVSSAMWASRAGVVLVSRPSDSSQISFSLNLAHEFGFFHGQSKPILLLAENDTEVINELDAFTNAKGMTVPRFNRDHAFNPNHEESIAQAISRWVTKIRESLGPY